MKSVEVEGAIVASVHGDIEYIVSGACRALCARMDFLGRVL